MPTEDWQSQMPGYTFPAAQLQHFAGWRQGEGLGTVGKLVSHWFRRHVPCHELETGGMETRLVYPTLALMYKIWDRGKAILGLTG